MWWKYKKTKYGNEKCEYKGIKFASKKEMHRYLFLSKMQEQGVISNLQQQTVIEIVPAIKGTKTKQLKTKTKEVEYTIQLAINYKADFTYHDKYGNFVVEDVKGSEKTLTKVYQLKKKLLYALKNMEVHEVYSPTQPIIHKINNEEDKQQ